MNIGFIIFIITGDADDNTVGFNGAHIALLTLLCPSRYLYDAPREYIPGASSIVR